MRNLSTFALEIERTENHEPTRVSVVLSTAAPDADGVLRLTPQCMTLDELEGAINALQDELDVLRADARRRSPSALGMLERGEVIRLATGEAFAKVLKHSPSPP
jgi:hypothetical protein